MSVTLKWVGPEKVSGLQKEGWCEVKLHDDPYGEALYLMASPVAGEEPAKVECPNCRKGVDCSTDHCSMDQALGGPLAYDCKPAQPKPATPSDWRDATDESIAFDLLTKPAAPVEMPEAVTDAVKWLRAEARAWECDTPNAACKAREISDALESFWRTHAAQPAPIRMTLPKVRLYLESLGMPVSQAHINALAELDAAERKAEPKEGR